MRIGGKEETQLTISEQQATGLERFELLGKLEGVDVFDMKPMEMTRIGTVQDPIPIYSLVSHLRLWRRTRRLHREVEWNFYLRLAQRYSGALVSRDTQSSRLETDDSSPNVTLDVQVSQPIPTIQSGWSLMIKSRTIGVLNVVVVSSPFSLICPTFPSFRQTDVPTFHSFGSRFQAFTFERQWMLIYSLQTQLPRWSTRCRPPPLDLLKAYRAWTEGLEDEGDGAEELDQVFDKSYLIYCLFVENMKKLHCILTPYMLRATYVLCWLPAPFVLTARLSTTGIVWWWALWDDTGSAIPRKAVSCVPWYPYRSYQQVTWIQMHIFDLCNTNFRHLPERMDLSSNLNPLFRLPNILLFSSLCLLLFLSLSLLSRSRSRYWFSLRW